MQKKPGQGQIDRALYFAKAPSRAGLRRPLLLASCGVFNVMRRDNSLLFLFPDRNASQSR
jgi:hypothetical protein